METGFSADQLADPKIKHVNEILRRCVHCGFCSATCPTYLLRGDELDSPRGRIYLIKNMLEDGGVPSAATVKHLDRCLTCLSCMTTCPSGVDYRDLLDDARVRIETRFRRSFKDRLMRSVLSVVLPRPKLFRMAVRGAKIGKRLRALMPKGLRPLLEMAPATLPRAASTKRPMVHPAIGQRRARMALLPGCVQQVVRPQINQATIRLLTRHGVEVVEVRGPDCCGAIGHHLGKDSPAVQSARGNVAALWEERESRGLDGIVVTASGCATMVKDYGRLLADDHKWAKKAAQLSGLVRDVSEVIGPMDLDYHVPEALRIAYHSPCSMQHGLRLGPGPRDLLIKAGFEVVMPKESHICCGSAGTYSILQPQLSKELKARKLAHLDSLEADVVATGNVGCMIHLETGSDLRIVHFSELLDWATGGAKPHIIHRKS